MSDHTHKHPLNFKEAKLFLFGGNATFTVKSKKTGSRYTFKVKVPKNFKGDSKPFFVSYLNGPDNYSNYSFLGTIFVNDNSVTYKHSKKSKTGKDSTVNKTFQWLFNVLTGKFDSTNFDLIEFWHEDKCSVCGRKLTDPQSIKVGIGPICRGPKSKAQFRESRLQKILANG